VIQLHGRNDKECSRGTLNAGKRGILKLQSERIGAYVRKLKRRAFRLLFRCYRFYRYRLNRLSWLLSAYMAKEFGIAGGVPFFNLAMGGRLIADSLKAADSRRPS
jgi:hypothetical protein